MGRCGIGRIVDRDRSAMNFLLAEILLQPSRVVDLDNTSLGILIAQARSSGLLASLALEMETVNALEKLPWQARRHFLSGILIHQKQQRDLVFDSAKIYQALSSIGAKTVMLKGAAYLLAELPVGRGRLITDIDIIVPKACIEQAERALADYGWEGHDISAYDDQYYRRWGHEIPPLTNKRRDTTLDVHHNILPPTAGPDVHAELLFENLLEVKPGIFTLSWQDMVIHSATHLFHEGEFHRGLRDLWDLDRMLRDFPNRDPAFWRDLITRARKLDLLVPLFHALNYSQQVFGTPIPKKVIEDAEDRLKILRKPLMDFLFLRALRPDHTSCRLPFSRAALNLLYLRSHYLRMPLYLLIPHLIRKAWRARFDEPEYAPAREQTGTQ